MVSELDIPVKRNNALSWQKGFMIAYIIIGVATLHRYVSFLSPAFLLGLGSLPVLLQLYPGGSKSYRYAWIAFVVALCCYCVPVKTLLYFTICFALLFIRESVYGKTGVLAPAVVLFASPLFQYITNTFSFPLRIQLTAVAGSIFRLLGYPVQTQGNMILYRGNEFSVDPACMGLNMIITSLLLGIIVIAFYQVKWKKRPGYQWIFFYLLLVLLLNVIANLLRILLLVLFNILPDTVSHDVTGIACLLVYVFIPSVWLASLLVKRAPVYAGKAQSVKPEGSFQKKMMVHFLLLTSILLLAYRVNHADTFNRFKTPLSQEVPGYTITQHSPGIIKMENNEALLYVKYIRSFYDTEHSPMLCWTGSGYHFERIREENISGSHVYTARLTNGSDLLYTAWWYDNGSKRTLSQFDWRLDMIKGARHYAVINISCSTKEKLENEIHKIFNQQTLSAFFRN